MFEEVVDRAADFHRVAIITNDIPVNQTALPLYLYQQKAKVFVVNPSPPVINSIEKYLKKKVQNPNQIQIAVNDRANYTNNFLSEIMGNAETFPVETSLVYCDAKHMMDIMIKLLQYSYSRRQAAFCDVLIISEAQEDLIEYYIIKRIYNFLYGSGIRIPALILLSRSPELQINIDPEAIIDWRRPVDTSLITITTSIPQFRVYSPEIYNEMSKEILKLDKPGIWLAFCPSLTEINLIVNRLKGSHISYQIVAVKTDVVKPITRKEPHVILTTSLLNGGAPLDEIDGIFDSMVYCREEIVFGMVSNLQYKTLYTKHFENRLRLLKRGTYYKINQVVNPEEYKKERELISLTKYLIHISRIKVDSSVIINDPRSSFVLRVLIDNGIFDPHTNKISDVGNFVEECPLDPYNSVILYQWIKSNKPIVPCVIALSLIETPQLLGPGRTFEKLVDIWNNLIITFGHSLFENSSFASIQNYAKEKKLYYLNILYVVRKIYALVLFLEERDYGMGKMGPMNPSKIERDILPHMMAVYWKQIWRRGKNPYLKKDRIIPNTNVAIIINFDTNYELVFPCDGVEPYTYVPVSLEERTFDKKPPELFLPGILVWVDRKIEINDIDREIRLPELTIPEYVNDFDSGNPNNDESEIPNRYDVDDDAALPDGVSKIDREEGDEIDYDAPPSRIDDFDLHPNHYQ